MQAGAEVIVIAIVAILLVAMVFAIGNLWKDKYRK
jgi:hypothetical protein